MTEASRQPGGRRFLIVWIVLPILPACRATELPDDYVLDLRREALTCLKMAATTNPNPAIRADAIQSLNFALETESGCWVQQGLFDPDPEVRFAACMTSSRIDPAGTASALERLLSDDHPAVRAAAMYGLMKTGQLEYQEPLVEFLLGSAALHQSRLAEPLFRAVAEWVSIAELREWLESRAPEEASLRRCARVELLRRGDPAATRQTILTAQSGPPAEQSEAIKMLAWSVDPKVLYILQDQLEHCPDVEGRMAAARSLASFDSAAGLATAVRGLDYPQGFPDAPQALAAEPVVEIRLAACQACAEIGDRRCLGALAPLLSDADDRLRVGSAAAIVRLTSQHGTSPK